VVLKYETPGLKTGIILSMFFSILWLLITFTPMFLKNRENYICIQIPAAMKGFLISGTHG
jgi:hypothetical protein